MPPSVAVRLSPAMAPLYDWKRACWSASSLPRIQICALTQLMPVSSCCASRRCSAALMSHSILDDLGGAPLARLIVVALAAMLSVRIRSMSWSERKAPATPLLSPPATVLTGPRYPPLVDSPPPLRSCLWQAKEIWLSLPLWPKRNPSTSEETTNTPATNPPTNSTATEAPADPDQGKEHCPAWGTNQVRTGSHAPVD